MDSNYFSENKKNKKKIDSLLKRINNIEENIDLIKTKKSKYVYPTDIPLPLDQAQKEHEKELEKVQIELDSLRTIIKQQPKVPRLLPYSLNRGKQIEELKQKISDSQNKTKPLICFLHGNKTQCHDTFIEIIINDILKKEYNYIPKKYIVKFPQYSIKSQNDFNKQLFRELINEIKTNKINEDYLEIFFNDNTLQVSSILPAQPTVVYISFSVSEWCEDSIKLVKYFFDFWQQCNFANYYQFLMVCLSVQYISEDTLSFWKKIRLKLTKEKININFEKVFSLDLSQIDQVIVTVLSELKSIGEAEVDNWISFNLQKQISDVEFITQLKNQTQIIYRNWRKQKSSNVIPMNYLAMELKKLLQGNFLDEEEIG